MKINKIFIKGFKSYHQGAYINFKNPLSILYGLNGSGKTTVLKIIHSVLKQDETYLMHENVREISIEYHDDSLFETSIRVYYNEEVESYIWDELENSSLFKSRTLLIGVQRGLQIRNISVSSSIIYEFLIHHPSSRELFETTRANRSRLRFMADELSAFINRQRKRTSRRNQDELLPKGNHVTMDEVSIEVIAEALYNEYYNVKRKISVKIYNALFETFALAIDEEKVGEIEIPDNIVEIIQENQTRLIEALEDAPENEFKEMVIQRIDTLTINDKEHFQRNKLFTQLLLQMVQELEQEKEELGILNILIQVFNSMLSEGKEIIMDREGINIKVNGSTHGLNELSSGERHLLTFLTIILLDGYSRDIILIDEPEISLNILWQEKLIDLITRLAPNTQIIVASHSQSIVAGHTNSLVEIEKRHLS